MAKVRSLYLGAASLLLAAIAVPQTYLPAQAEQIAATVNTIVITSGDVAKALGAFVLAYALSPIDLIPDFIPVLGYLDDALLLPGLIWLTVRLLPPQVLADSRSRAEGWLADAGARPRSLAGAAAILLLWTAALALAAWWVWRHLHG